jgi:hypothetical protein
MPQTLPPSLAGNGKRRHTKRVVCFDSLKYRTPQCVPCWNFRRLANNLKSFPSRTFLSRSSSLHRSPPNGQDTVFRYSQSVSDIGLAYNVYLVAKNFSCSTIWKETRRDDIGCLVREARCFSSPRFFEALLLIHMRRLPVGLSQLVMRKHLHRFIPISDMSTSICLSQLVIWKHLHRFIPVSNMSTSIGLSQLVMWEHFRKFIPISHMGKLP